MLQAYSFSTFWLCLTSLKLWIMNIEINKLKSTASYTVTFLNILKTIITNSDTTKRLQYLLINPHLQPSPHLRRNLTIPEQNRIATSRLRLSSETGRWSRTPLEWRTWTCQNGIQSELHILTYHPLSQYLRDSYSLYPQSIHELFIWCDNDELNHIVEHIIFISDLILKNIFHISCILSYPISISSVTRNCMDRSY